jgi:8-amino-7-oxononanoate synthase
MDGDIVDLPVLAALCQRNRATLMVDDAHGFGVLGAGGRGIAEHFFPSPASRVPSSGLPDIYVATLGKSLGAAGAFVAGSDALIEYLIQRARSWVFSTAPPPAIAAAARESLRIVQREPEHRQRLFANIARFVQGARRLGIFETTVSGPRSSTPIQPLVLGDAARALAVSRALYERGFWVAAIRPPTVPQGTSRLRITLSAAHTPEQIDGLLEALRDALALSGRTA